VLLLWDNAETRNTLIALVRSAVSNEEVARMLHEFVTATISTRVAKELGMPGV
jgi:Tetracyclin repressor-like, C-terminal domain